MVLPVQQLKLDMGSTSTLPSSRDYRALICGSTPFRARLLFNSPVRRSRPLAAVDIASDIQESTIERPPITISDWATLAPSKFIHDWRAFVEQHRIRGYEAGPDQRTTMMTIANILQEVASNHAVAMWGRSSEGFATDPALADKGLIFVATRMQVSMDQYPKWGDVVEVETWFQESGKIGAQRDWVVRDVATGKLLGRATSTWVMINMRTRRLSKLPEEIRNRLASYQRQPPKDAFPPGRTRLKIPDLEEETLTTGHKQVARRSDMDMNGHINNVTYLAWAIESVPPEVYENAHLYQIEVDYKAECHAGDVIEGLASHAETSEGLTSNGAGSGALSYIHLLRRWEEDKCTELVRARTTWRIGDRNI